MNRDDPRVAELLRRRASAKAAKAAADPPAPAPAPKLRSNPTVAGRCADCGGRMNSFNGRCPRCDARAPTALDLVPVRPRPELEPEPEPEPEPAEGPVPPNPTTAPDGTPEVEVEVEAAAGAKTCPTCGRPCNPLNGRCYACRPGGAAGSRSGAARMPRPVPARAVTADPELAAIAGMTRLLEELPREAAVRALAYVVARLRLGTLTAAAAERKDGGGHP